MNLFRCFFLCIIISSPAAFGGGNEVCFSSLLLASSPAMEIKLQNDIVLDMSLVLQKSLGENVLSAKSKIIFSSGSKKMTAVIDAPLITSRKDSLIVTLLHISELYGCTLTMQGDNLYISAVSEIGELVQKRYHLSQYLVAFVLRADKPDAIDADHYFNDKKNWDKFKNELLTYKLQIVGIDQDSEELLLRGRLIHHDSFVAAISGFIFRLLDEDEKSRTEAKR